MKCEKRHYSICVVLLASIGLFVILPLCIGLTWIGLDLQNRIDTNMLESNETFIKVTGTSFNIKGNDPDSLVEVYVKTGSVLFFTAKNEGVSLVAGETGVYNKNQGTFTKTKESDSNVTAYANRVFVFYNTTLNEVFRQLSKVYGVTIVPEDAQLGLTTITVSFNDDEIETILNIIAETLSLKYRSDGQNHYTFEGQTSISGEKTP